MLDKKITHSIYMIKNEFVLKNKYLQNIETCKKYIVPITGNKKATIYLKMVPSKDHSWSRLLPTDISGINWDKFRTKSLYGLLLFKVDDRVFALTSGFGRYLLHPFSIEYRFGFKTVLNSINPQTIQQIAKTTLSDNPKSAIEQVSKGVNISHFGIDGFTDLISRVKGKSKIENLGLSLDGEDALKISVAHEINQLPNLLRECRKYFDSDDYKKYFSDIDNLAQVKDKEQKLLLNKKLESSLNAELDKIINRSELSGDTWASIPELIFDEGVECFTYTKSKYGLRYYDIELKDIFTECYLKKNKTRKRDVSITTLKNDKIYFLKSDGTIYPRWRALNCINATIELDKEQFFFLEGNWFRARTSYVESLDQKIRNIPSSNFLFNDWPQQISEEKYLKSRPLANNNDYIVLDRKLIYLKGQKPVEPCDIFTKNKQMVHLKRYGSSSLLGHLFNQGFVSGNLLINSVEYKKKFKEKIATNFDFRDINPSEFTVSYVIGTKHPNSPKLPLFSKITLTKAFDELRKKGFNVTLDFCRVSLK